MFDSFRSVIAAWPSLAVFASDIGVAENTAKKMRQRDSIAPEYWSSAVTAADVRGVAGVTLELLAQLAEKRRRAA